MLRKKTPPEYGESLCQESALLQLQARDDATELTGPMIVACQWNCYQASQSV